MHRRKELLLSGSLTLLLIGGNLCGAAEDGPLTITKEGVLQWVEDNRDAQPGFQPGSILKLADLEKLRPFLPPGYLEEFRFADVSFAIAPSGDYAPPQVFREATEKYTGQTRLAADGSLEGYVAGQPFVNASLNPQDPTAGLKAMWNYNFRWQHYGQKTTDWHFILLRKGRAASPPTDLPQGLLEGEGTIDRRITLNHQLVYLNHLAMLPDTGYTLPVPGAEPFEWKLSVDVTYPYDVRGQQVVMHRYAGHRHEDDIWAYIPSLRKVRRLSAEDKVSDFLGTEFIIDDFYGFFGLVSDYQWKFHGWKDVLHVMNSQWQDYPRYYGPGSWLPRDRWEVRRCAVVEQVPKNPSHPYSSRLLFVDAQTYQLALALAFDRQDKTLWRVMNFQYQWSEDGPKPLQVSIARPYGAVVLDIKAQKATVAPILHDEYPRVTAEDAGLLFDVNKLMAGKR